MQRIWGLERFPPSVHRCGIPQLETRRRGRRACGFDGDPIDQRLPEAHRLLVADILASLPSDLTPMVLPGAPALLERRGAAGAHLGLVTGTVGDTATAVLERGGLARYLQVAAYGDEGGCREELLRLTVEWGMVACGLSRAGLRLVAVGDAASDIAAGKAVKARTVGVGTGDPATGDHLQLGADLALEDLQDAEAATAAIMRLAEAA